MEPLSKVSETVVTGTAAAGAASSGNGPRTRALAASRRSSLRGLLRPADRRGVARPRTRNFGFRPSCRHRATDPPPFDAAHGPPAGIGLPRHESADRGREVVSWEL